MPATLSERLLLSVPDGQPREGSFLSPIHMDFHLCRQGSSALPQHCQQAGSGREHRSAMPSHPEPEKAGLGQGTQSNVSARAPSFQATRDGQRTAPATNSGKIRSPLISTRANLTSFPANTGQETALPPQEGQGAQGALMAQPLVLLPGNK